MAGGASASAAGAAEESGAGDDDVALRARIRELLAAASGDLGYRAVHATLKAEERFSGVGIKRVQRLMRELRDEEEGAPASRSTPQAAAPAPAAAPAAAAAAPAAAGRGGGVVEVEISRPDISQRFGMLISTGCDGSLGGYAVTDVREGGVVAEWNSRHPGEAIQKGDAMLEVNGRSTFEGMMEELKRSLTCKLRLRRVGTSALVEDTSEADREAAKWAERKARVTAALIPGLKKIVDSEFGAGASGRIGRVEKMYQMIGRNEVHEVEGPLGKQLAPGYIEGFPCEKPFHDLKDHPWCAELKRHWKAIRQELRANLDESLWTPGAFAKSNEAYGKDWKIMGVLTADKWQDEARFKVTSNAVRQLRGVTPSEVFFARMPPHTKIAPHSDNLNYILTSHLALELEEGKCSITCGNEERAWKEGEMLVLDTSFIHSTKNESKRPRYILVFRFWHPHLSEEERRAIHVSHAILAGTGKQ